MDIKSKNIRYSTIFKLLAYAACACGAVAAFLGFLSMRSVPAAVLVDAAQGLWWVGGGLAAWLLGLVWLMVTAGRSASHEGVRLIFIDRVFTDVSLAVACFAEGTCLTLLVRLIMGMRAAEPSAASLFSCIAIVAAGALLLAVYISSVARLVKRREFMSRTLTYVAVAWVFRVCRRAFAASPAFLKWAMLLLVYSGVSGVLLSMAATGSVSHNTVILWATSILFCTVQIVAIVFLYKKYSALKAILEGVRKIKSGDLSYRIALAGGNPYTDIAASVNTIAEGLNAAVEDRVRAERMKSELISNVSHDLKTPLTSILTYVDLLKAEGPSGENFTKYVGILDAKAKRLKGLTDDLFEAAKATSGNIKPQLVRLDAAELLSQGLGELADRIRESTLDFRVNAPADGLLILADGRLLWRVLENLFSNAFKYALPYSRVYITAARAGGVVRLEVKNISAYELNIPAEELTERFTRGDKSRGSEGSGLGLAIAKSLTELQGGQFRLEVDGDLFKAIVEFPEDI